MENYRLIRKPAISLVLGGVLIGGALFISANFARSYDQNNTHPALTDEAIDFYNLAFPSNRLTEDDKKWLIKGAIDEDTTPRPLNHFYDPVYNQGWIGYTPSKVWAYSSEKQVAFFGGKSQTASFAQLFINNELSADDYSYQRALYDYAVGDRKRAMIAMGHIMHLLEDANVPDHARNDTHLPFPSTESPYEKEMAKWNPGNLDIAGKIFANGAKPILLSGLEDYFDKIAKYSNGYFFSEDTILNENYLLPRKISEKAIEENEIMYRFALGRDKNKELFPLFRMDPISRWRNLATPTKFTIDSSIVLNEYWSRLSKDFIPHGAGVLKLFLEQAEKVKREYVKNQQVVRNPSMLGGVLGLLGISGQSEPRLAFDPSVIDSILSMPSVPIGTVGVPIGTLTSSPTPSPIPLARLSLSPTLSPTSLTPLLTPSPTPFTTLSPSPILSPSPLPIPTQETSQLKKSGRVVISEIGWSGTTASATDEWIELYNAESEAIDISGWLLKSDDDSPSIIFSKDTIIPANSYFLIERTDDNAISSVNADLIASFGQGGLKDTGEVLFLYDSAGSLVDKVGISGLPWFAGGTSSKLSMERIDQLRGGDEQSNWKTFSGAPSAYDAKGNLVNGTPRSENSPVIVTSGGGGGGGLSLSPTPAPSLLPTPEPVSPETKVVINEIAWMGTATSSNDEWLELYNITSKSVDLSSWRLRSLTDNTPNIALASKSIEPFGFFLLERTNDNPISDISADQIYKGGLNDAGEALELRDKYGNLHDFVGNAASSGFSPWFAGSKTGRFTMERIDPTKVGDNSANWATNNGITRNGKDAASNPINGTPRARNSVYVNKPPSAVSDLKVDTETSFFGNIRLTWLVPKDDDDLPRKLTYDLRYITATPGFDWDGAFRVASSSLPAVAASGTPASASFQILDYNRDYYFALKTCDKEACSEISNQPKYTIKPAISNEIVAFRGPAGPATISWQFRAASASYINQPVISKDGTIYFGVPNDTTGTPRLYAIGSDGIEKWHHDNETVGFGIPTTPAISDDGAVYFGHLDPGSYVTALNPDGTPRWLFDIGDHVNGVSVDEDGNVYATSDNQMINKIGPNGSESWRVQNSYTFGFTPIAIPGDKDVYLAADSAGLPEFYRLRGSDGSIVWQNRISDSYQYQAFDLAYDKETDQFYTATTVGHIISVNRSDGTIGSQSFAFGVPATTKVAIFEDILAFGVDFTLQNLASGQAVIALNKADKSVAWTFPVDSRVNKEIAVDADGNLYFATENGKVYSLDKAGTKRWVLDLGAPTELYPVLGENAVFMGVGGSSGGKLVKIADN